LFDAIAAQLPPGVTVALSGGVDAALLLAIAARAGLRPQAVTLVTGLAAYDEAEAAEATARALGVPWRAVRVTVDEVVAAWPAAVARAGWPLYNLHPVARGLLVRAVAGEGVADLVTGDGVDARLAGVVDHLYLPAVAPLLAATACRVRWPLAAALPAPDPGKAALRAWAARLGVPAAVAWGPKAPRWFPEVDAWREDRRLAQVADRLGRPLTPDLTRWVSLDLLLRDAGAA
jgi:asparagine synthetase B (glutamine-hydrolysing)